MASFAEHILIVETDPDITDVISRQALKPLGYNISVVGEVPGAIEYALNHQPDLIMTSMNLPGLSGKDLLVALKSQGIQTPLIVIAGKDQENDAIQAFRLGATDVLFWPAQDAEVLAAVERALSQTKESRERQKLDRQLKVANEELSRRLSELTSILSIGKAVVSLTDQRELFGRILEGALQVAEADITWLLLREERTKTLLLRAHLHLPQAWAKKLDQPLDDGISSLVALSGESLVMNGDSLSKFKISALGKSAGVIPIKVQSEVIGLLLVVRKTDREFNREAQDLLEAMADYASISLVNARLFRALEYNAQTARNNEKIRYASLVATRNAIREEVKAITYPLNLVLTEMPGALNAEQKQALESVQRALNRLSRLSEMTVPTDAILEKEKSKA